MHVKQRRRHVAQPQAAFAGMGDLGQQAVMGAVERLAHQPPQLLFQQRIVLCGPLQVVGRHLLVPDLQRPHARSPADGHLILTCTGCHHVAHQRRRHALLASSQHGTHQQALEVPLPRRRMRFVKVIDVEHQVAFGRGKQPEVHQVRVAAGLHGNAGTRPAGQIVSLHQRRATEIGKRRRQHAPVTQGHQRRHPPEGGLLQQGQRIAVAACRQLGVGRARRTAAPGLAFGIKRFVTQVGLVGQRHDSLR